MAGTTVKSSLTPGLVGSVSRHMAIEHNKLVDDVEAVRGGARQLVQYQIEDLGAGADISAAGFYIAPRASTVLDSVRVIYRTASAAVDGSNTSVIRLINVTDSSAVIASITKTATTSANAVETLTLVAADADLAANDVLGLTITNGASADTGLMLLQFEVQPQAIDAAGDMTAAKIGNHAGTAISA